MQWQGMNLYDQQNQDAGQHNLVKRTKASHIL